MSLKDDILKKEDHERKESSHQAFEWLYERQGTPEWIGFEDNDTKVIAVRGGTGQVHVGDVFRAVFPTLDYCKRRNIKLVLATSPNLESVFREWGDTLTLINANQPPEAVYDSFLEKGIQKNIRWSKLLQNWQQKLRYSFDKAAIPVTRSSSLTLQNPQTAIELRKKYSEDGTKKVLGIIWRTSMIGRDPNRNAELADFRDAFDLKSSKWNAVSLQYGSLDITRTELQTKLPKGSDIIFDDHIDPMRDYVSASAQMIACDHIISIDCSQVFQAGAFGVPVSVILGKERKSDQWTRFGLKDHHGICPFFPETSRIFVQEKLGKWDSPIKLAIDHLKEDIKQRGRWDHPAAHLIKTAEI